MSEAARTVGWGFIGAGEVAVQFADALRLVPGARLVSVGSRSRERAERFAAGFGAKPQAAYEAVVADPEVDVVYVATPAAQHAAHALLAIEAGKAVLVEKPFATSTADAERVVAAARARGVFCMEAMWMHFVPAIARAVELVKEGAIGEPRMMSADFGVPTVREPGQRLFEPDGGGALLDRGVYPIHLACRLFGEPTDVVAMTTPVDGVDEHTAVLLRFAGGQVAMLGTTLTSYGANAAVLMGTTGRLTVGEPLCRPDTLGLAAIEPMRVTAGGGIGPAGLKERLRHHPLARRLHAALRPRSRTIRVPYEGNGYVHEAAEVTRCVRAGLVESPTLPLEVTLGVMRVVERVREVWR